MFDETFSETRATVSLVFIIYASFLLAVLSRYFSIPFYKIVERY